MLTLRLQQMKQFLSRFLDSRRMEFERSVDTETARTYTHSPELPPHPGPEWTRFVCISDTHSRTHYNLPPGDVLLHAGDLSSWGYPAQLKKTLDWMERLDYPMKILIAGNHDLCLDKELPAFEEDQAGESLAMAQEYMKGEKMKKANVHYLEHEPFTFTTGAGRKWVIYGSPATPRYAAGAFQYIEPGEAEVIYDRIPLDTEILLTHTPPKGCLDLTSRGNKAGCGVLRRKLETLKACRLHVFGHIHEDGGVGMIQTQAGVRVVVNAAIARTETAIVVDLLN